MRRVPVAVDRSPGGRAFADPDLFGQPTGEEARRLPLLVGVDIVLQDFQPGAVGALKARIGGEVDDAAGLHRIDDARRGAAGGAVEPVDEAGVDRGDLGPAVSIEILQVAAVTLEIADRDRDPLIADFLGDDDA